jgi:FixJ family two-component response regulator
VVDPTVFIIYGDDAVRDSMRVLLEAEGWTVQEFASLTEFLATATLAISGCLIIEALGASGDNLAWLAEVRKRDFALPAVVLSHQSDAAFVLRAFVLGATTSDPMIGLSLSEAVRAAMTPRSSAAHG